MRTPAKLAIIKLSNFRAGSLIDPAKTLLAQSRNSETRHAEQTKQPALTCADAVSVATLKQSQPCAIILVSYYTHKRLKVWQLKQQASRTLSK